MGKIDNYEAIDSFIGSERFVVETDDGTRKAPFTLIQDKITDCVEDKAEMLAFNDISVTKNTESEYVLDITIGTTHITTPNLKGKSIKSISIEAGHLIIRFSDDTSIDAGVIDGSIPAYGVCRDINSHSPNLKRVGDAVDLIANAAVDDEIVRNDFDSIYPWCDIKKCTLADDGTVTSYFGDASYVEDGSIGQVMVEIPKFYLAHYVDESETKEYWYISKEKINSRYRLPRPFIAKDGTELDKIYIAAYFSSDEAIESEVLDSRAGNVYCENGITHKEAISKAAARGSNWHLMDISEWNDVIQPLFIVEFATLDSQAIMGGNAIGNTNFKIYLSENLCWGDQTDTTTEIIGNTFYTNVGGSLFIGQEIAVSTEETYLTGDLDSVLYGCAIRKITNIEMLNSYDIDGVVGDWGVKVTFDGEPIKMVNEAIAYTNSFRNGITNGIKSSSGYNSGIVGNQDMIYRGFENLYGLFNCIVTGVYIKDGCYYVTDKIEKYGSTVIDDYINAGNIPSAVSGYINTMLRNPEVPWVNVPTECDGSSNEDYCDLYYKRGASTVLSVGFGKSYKNSTEHGIFAYYCHKNSITSNVRLAYRAYN